MATLSDLAKLVETSFPGKVLSLVCAEKEIVSRIDYSSLATKKDRIAVKALVNSFDWTKPSPNIPGFFNELALTILAGALPQDVHPKAKLVQDIISPADQAAALVALASDPSYSKEQVITLNQLMAKHGLELPAVERE